MKTSWNAGLGALTCPDTHWSPGVKQSRHAFQSRVFLVSLVPGSELEREYGRVIPYHFLRGKESGSFLSLGSLNKGLQIFEAFGGFLQDMQREGNTKTSFKEGCFLVCLVLLFVFWGPG